MVETPQPGCFKLVETAAAWIDLLGYGSQLQMAGHDLSSSEAQHAIRRALEFQQVFNRRETFMRVAVFNDGALLVSDLEDAGDYRGSRIFVSDPWKFVRHALVLHARVNEVESGSEHPGARMIVCRGQRVLRGRQVPHLQKKNLDYAMRNISKRATGPSGEQTKLDRMTDEAHEPTILAPSHLQFNSAFARAYTADNLGQRAGLGGPFAFVDTRLLNPIQERCPWSFHSVGIVDSEDEQPRNRVLGEAIEFKKAVQIKHTKLVGA